MKIIEFKFCHLNSQRNKKEVFGALTDENFFFQSEVINDKKTIFNVLKFWMCGEKPEWYEFVEEKVSHYHYYFKHPVSKCS